MGLTTHQTEDTGKRTECTALLVEDDTSYRTVLRFMLEEWFPAVAIEEAGNGKEALERLESRPDIIFMDMRLPDASGITLTREIKERHPRTVIVMLTGEEFDDYSEGAFAAGASDFLVKGSGLDGIKKWMQTLCS